MKKIPREPFFVLFCFSFHEVRSPNSCEFGQWGCFSKCAVRKLPDWRFLKCYCPKSPAMLENSNSRQNAHSQYVTSSCRGQSICFSAKSCFGVFLLCLWHNFFYVTVSCFKFFSSFYLWGLPWKSNISNCRKTLKACRSFKNFWICNWFFALQTDAMLSTQWHFNSLGKEVLWVFLTLNKWRHFVPSGFVCGCFPNSIYTSFSQPHMV